MKKIILLGLVATTFLHAALIGTAKKQDSGTFLLANYYIDFQSDVIRKKDGSTLLDDYGWREQTYAFKPVYYKDDFLYSITIPYRKMQREFTDEMEYGLLDVVATFGYFIPNSFGDLLWLSSVQFPTASYDPNKPKVYFGTVDALQMGTNRYELQEELHFFKPVLSTKLPFLIDSTLAYHFRGKNLDTKVKNGYYFGAELTISAVLSKDFFIGPAVYYKKYDKDGIVPDIGSSKYQVGVDALYKFNEQNSLCIEYVKDQKVKNRLEGDRFIARYVYKF
jgi:hypothetical protein